MIAVCRVLCVDCGLLFVGGRSLLCAVRRSLLFAVCWSLFAVVWCSLMAVVCYLACAVCLLVVVCLVNAVLLAGLWV